MAYVPKFRHLIKLVFGMRDPAAAEGLFLEGSIEFESGELETARTMFLYGTRLDPNLAGNFYNLAVATERLGRPRDEVVGRWEAYLEAADRDPRQSQEARERVRKHLATLRAAGENQP